MYDVRPGSIETAEQEQFLRMWYGKRQHEKALLAHHGEQEEDKGRDKNVGDDGTTVIATSPPMAELKLEKGCVVMVVGLPGAGKSSWCRVLRSLAPGKFRLQLLLCQSQLIGLERMI